MAEIFFDSFTVNVLAKFSEHINFDAISSTVVFKFVSIYKLGVGFKHEITI
jgi:hypothetical protein